METKYYHWIVETQLGKDFMGDGTKYEEEVKADLELYNKPNLM